MERIVEEELMLTLFRQCSPMQRMLVIDALQELLAMPGEIDLFSEGLRGEYAEESSPLDKSAAGAENMGKILPFCKR